MLTKENNQRFSFVSISSFLVVFFLDFFENISLKKKEESKEIF
jgi:hypothetical protein